AIVLMAPSCPRATTTAAIGVNNAAVQSPRRAPRRRRLCASLDGTVSASRRGSRPFFDSAHTAVVQVRHVKNGRKKNVPIVSVIRFVLPGAGRAQMGTTCWVRTLNQASTPLMTKLMMAVTISALMMIQRRCCACRARHPTVIEAIARLLPTDGSSTPPRACPARSCRCRRDDEEVGTAVDPAGRRGMPADDAPSTRLEKRLAIAGSEIVESVLADHRQDAVDRGAQ